MYGDNKDRMLYEDDKFECFLVGKDIFLLAKKVMIVLKKVYNSESVYLCTMCDGPMNHFHIQLIPRYSFENRGSKNFVKPRMKYIEDKEKIQEIRKLLENN